MAEFEEIYNIFVKKGYKFDKNTKGNLVISKGGKKLTDAAFCDAFDFVSDDYEGGADKFRAEVVTVLERQAKERREQELCELKKAEGSLYLGVMRRELKSERFRHIDSLNEAYYKVYGRFRFAHTGIGEIVLLVQATNREWRAVPLKTGNKTTNDEKITPVCSAIFLENGETLSDYIERSFKECQLVASSVLRNSEDSGNNDVQAQIACQFFPSNVCAVGAVQELSHTKTIETKTGKESIKVVDGLCLWDEYKNCIQVFDASRKWLFGRREVFMPLPQNISNDPNVDCLHYIDLDDIRSHIDEDCHTWDKYMQRYTEDEAKVFKAWIWGIFDASNHGRQMLYIHDTGQSGKSTLINAITSVLGEHLVQAAQKDSFSNNFSVAKIWDKRLITIGDNKNRKIVMSQFIHSVLGGDTMEVEHKGRNSFSARVRCKVLAASNELPEIDLMADNETSRIIIVQPKLTEAQMDADGLLKKKENGEIVRLPSGRPQNLGDPKFETAMIKEFKAFLAKCEAWYKELCPTGENIALPDSLWDVIRSAQSTPEQMFEDIFDQLFIVTNNPKDFTQRLSIQQAFEVHCKEHSCYSDLSYSDFKTWMVKKYQIQLGAIRGLRGFRGLVLKDCAEAQPALCGIEESTVEEEA